MQKEPFNRREKYHLNFKKVLKNLNKEQLLAVQQTEGPVLALAGPGTGKTHILSARIGQILLDSDTEAYNILCLTFTDAAVSAMRKRLLAFIGPEAHRVHIYTFHSFCNKVIQENLDHFGRHDLEPLSELERIDILRSLLLDLDIEHPLRVGKKDPYYYENHLKNLFKQMKSEHWAVDYLQGAITDYLLELPKQPEMLYKRKTGSAKAGDLKKAAFNKHKNKMKLLEAAIQLFPKYKDALEQKKRYDYEDMILWVIDAFENKEDLLRGYQEQYLYFLVDEFQDTNGSQNAILRKLVSYWGNNPNLFVVGDDDQSIYEFQGARIANMTDFYTSYQDNLLLVLLEKNYRSSQNILDAAKYSIDSNQIRLINQIENWENGKNLQAANPLVAAIDTPVLLVEYPNKLQEEIALVQQIEKLQKEGVALQNIAIIYAAHRQANNLIRLLEKRNIPYQTKRKINILELPLVINLRKLLTYIVEEYQQPYSGEAVFFEFLYYDFIGILPVDAARIHAYLAKAKQKKIAQQDYDNIPTWADTIRDKKVLESLNLKNIAKILALGEFLDLAIYNQKNSSLLKLFEQIINQSGLISFISNHKDKIWLTQLIGTLFEFIRRERTKNDQLDLEGLLKLLTQLDSNKIGLGLFQINMADDGINLLTAHSAKGLEFEYVFMINAVKDYWEPKKNVHHSFSFPSNIIFSNESDAYEAARRLFYVAMTRAKKQLQIAYYKKNTDEKEATKACFVDELVAVASPAIAIKEKTAAMPEDWQLLLLTTAPKSPPIALVSATIINELLGNFRLSVSALNNYLYCPLGFYYEYILRIPSFSSIEAAYGTAIHHAFKRVFDKAIKNENQLPPLSYLLEIFEFELKKQGALFSKKAFKERLVLGKRHLPKYYEQRKKDWANSLQNSTVITEKPLKNIVYKGVPMTGTIDKMIIAAKAIEVIDYKTGKLKKERLARPTAKNKLGGSYWRQLVFYKILIENSKIINQPIKTASIDYLTPNTEGAFPQKTIEFKEEDTKQVGNLIVETYQNILAHKFDTGCNKPSCKWCNFAKNNITPDSFNNENTERLDDKS